MGKKTWIFFGVICVVVIATVLVLMLVLVPQVKSTGVQAGEYQQLEKQQYTFSGEEIAKLAQQYSVTEKDVNSGKKTDKFDDGNINPFTPPKDISVYNEPTYNNENTSGVLTPNDK